MRVRVAALVVTAALLAACEPATVSIAYTPAVGDRYDVVSLVTTEVTRVLDGETATDARSDRLEASETVTGVDDDTVEVTVEVRRGGERSREFVTAFDRSGRLASIDIVDGVAAETLGVDLPADLPAAVTRPPATTLAPGDRWVIASTALADGTSFVSGRGAVVRLGVDDGVDVAVVRLDLDVELVHETATRNGTVTIAGRQTIEITTTYDLGGGFARAELTRIGGRVDVLVTPPAGVESAAVTGTIDYTVSIETARTVAA